MIFSQLWISGDDSDHDTVQYHIHSNHGGNDHRLDVVCVINIHFVQVPVSCFFAHVPRLTLLCSSGDSLE